MSDFRASTICFLLLGVCSTGVWGEGEPVSPQSQMAVIEEITVTAEKREERLHEIPVAITVLTGDKLWDLDFRTSSELATQVPNLEIKSAFNATNPTVFLRGVGLNDFNSNANGAVGIYSDEVYLSSPSAQVLQLFDLERVEVLHGPQGTLYGRNTTGGAINLVTKKPSGHRGGHARLTYGRFNQLDLEGAGELPLPELRGAMRLALVSSNRDGHTKNLYNGGDENDVDATAGRLQIRIAAEENLSVDVKVHGGINRAGTAAHQSRGLIDGADLLGYRESPNPFEGSYNRDLSEDLDLFGASVTVSWFRSGLTFTSVSAYEDSERFVVGDEDASPNQLIEIDWETKARQFSQEVRLSSGIGAHTTWIAGAYYFEEDLEVSNLFDVLRELRIGGAGFDPASRIFVLRQAYDQRSSSGAVFGRLDFQLSDALTVQSGLRFTSEQKEINFFTSFEEPTFSIPLIDFQGEAKDEAFSGEVALSYQAREELMFFSSVRRGFKSGGFNGGALFVNEEVSAVEPEFLTSFECGLKAWWFGRRLRFHATGFHYDYQDLQVFNFINAGDLSVQRLDNASDARVTGLELDLEARPVASLKLQIGLGLLDARYENFVLKDGTDFSGNRLIAAPRWSLNATAAYSWEALGGNFLAQVNHNYRDEQFFDPRNDPRVGSTGYGLTSARLAFESTDGRYGLALWGRNLTDEQYLIEVIDVAPFGYDHIGYGDPRTYGVEFAVRF